MSAFENIDKNSVSQYQRDPSQTDVLPYEQGSIMPLRRQRLFAQQPEYDRYDPAGDSDRAPGHAVPAGDIEGIRTMYGTPSTTTTIHTNPAGLTVIVDGAATATPVTFNWPPGSRHTLDVAAAPQQKGPKTTRYVFRAMEQRWPAQPDPGGQPRRTGWSAQTFAEQYFLETIAGTGRHGHGRPGFS